MKQPIPLFRNPFRRWTWSWLTWFCRDLVSAPRDFWHRGRYGWAPDDAMELYTYLYRVLAGTLRVMAEAECGAPGGYPNRGVPFADTDFDRWFSDLRRWSDAFDRATTDDFYEIHGHDFKAWGADELARSAAARQALQEILPWWESLWT